MDFEEQVKSGFYDRFPAGFMMDLGVWLEQEGVPKQYVDKVAMYAWDQGHAYGHSEVLTYAINLSEIFK